MARVHLALLEGAAGFEKPVALKEIHSNLTKDPAFVDMFLDEARIASLIQHPNVCHVFDFGQDEGGHYYLAMEYLLGESLAAVGRRVVRQKLHEHAGYPPLLARIISEVCEGLHAAHELTGVDGRPLGVVHRDVTPQNVFVTYGGVAKVVDFGIAMARDRIHRTSTGDVKGSAAYISPEQLRGMEVTRTADVWAVGVLLWELLAGRRLFSRRGNLETMYAVVNDPVPALSTVRADLPGELDAYVSRLLSRDPNLRPGTTREVGRELERIVGDAYGHAGAADVAEWMEQLFPGGERSKRQLLARAHDAASHAQAPHGASEPAEDADDSDDATATPERTGRRRQARRSRTPVWVGLGLLAAAGVAVGLWTYSKSSTEPAEREVTAGSAAASDESDTEEPTPGEPNDEPGAGTADNATPTESSSPDERSPEIPEAGSAQTQSADEEPSTARRPRSGGTGRLNLVTPGGWALVYLRGRELGQTPLRTNLPAGRHVLEVRPFGRTPGNRVRVVVPRGRTERVSVPVEP